MKLGLRTLAAAAVALCSGAASAAPMYLKDKPPPSQQIHNGIDAASCQFPATVAMLDKGSDALFCTGSLVHPRVVLFAAHCMDPGTSWATPGSVMFGEDVDAPVRVVEVSTCTIHPGWDFDGLDLAVCVLKEAVTEVPIVPLLMGCEVDQLQPGVAVTVAGFGASNADWNDGDVITSGAGIKRYTTQTVTVVDVGANDVLMVGEQTGACFGDSGGPSFLRLSDGTWRVFGAGSTLHPDAPYDDELCDYGTVYDLYWREMPWFEQVTGFDITPCHDAGGAWDPGPGCGGFPLSPDVGDGVWSQACATPSISGYSSSCGAPFSEGPWVPPDPPPPPPPPPDPPPPDPPPPPPPPDPPPPDPPPPNPDPDPDSGDETSEVGGLQDNDLRDRGCVCSSGQGDAEAPLWALTLAPLLIRRRRRV